LLDNNPADVSMLSGFGYNNLTPHSRAFGFMPGGLMLGPRGNAADEPFFDTGGFADWSCCEYWTTGIANAWLALARLLPRHIPTRSKLGMP
jgi:hypothetical protein